MGTFYLAALDRLVNKCLHKAVLWGTLMGKAGFRGNAYASYVGADARLSIRMTGWLFRRTSLRAWDLVCHQDGQSRAPARGMGAKQQWLGCHGATSRVFWRMISTLATIIVVPDIHASRARRDRNVSGWACGGLETWNHIGGLGSSCRTTEERQVCKYLGMYVAPLGAVPLSGGSSQPRRDGN